MAELLLNIDEKSRRLAAFPVEQCFMVCLNECDLSVYLVSGQQEKNPPQGWQISSVIGAG